MEMFNKVKKILVFNLVLFVILFMFLYITKSNYALEQNIDIEAVLREEAYSYLPVNAKNYIREFYESTGEVLLTEKNKIANKPYLNPAYIEYLDSDKNNYRIIPKSLIYDFVPRTKNLQSKSLRANSVLPSKFDLRDVDGKNYVTPFKNQGSEGLCWNFATNAHLESRFLVDANKSYDSSAIILSEKQVDYATAGWNKFGIKPYNYRQCQRSSISGGGDFSCSIELSLDGLGMVSSTWDNLYKDTLNKSEYLLGSQIYNFDNSFYEINSTISFPFLTSNDPSIRSEYLNAIKERIIQYGGAYISTDVCYDGVTTYDGKIIKIISRASDSSCSASAPHAMQLIGWDDNFEYKVCKRTHGFADPDAGDCDKSGYISGTGVWIIKNSWGDDESVEAEKNMLIGYDSIGTEIEFIADIGKRNWNNFYQLDDEYVSSSMRIYKFKNDSFVNSEKIKKIKFSLAQNTEYTIYFSSNGSSYQLIDNINTDYPGYYYLDVSNKDLLINKNSNFMVVTNGRYIEDFRVYTDNLDSSISIYSDDIVYDSSTEKFFQPHKIEFVISSKTKNISDGQLLTYKIKDSSGNYIDPRGYSYDLNDVYANVSNARLIIDNDYFDKGIYTVEVYYNNNKYTTLQLKIEIPLTVILGDGSSKNPWQITTTKQFYMIRNNPYDSFILMNDLDFEYDTTDPNGQFYNDGHGFEPIEEFYGYLDGKGHKLKNIYSKAIIAPDGYDTVRYAGIFNEINISGDINNRETSSCKFNKCGIYDLQIYNPIIFGSEYVGGISNRVNIKFVDQFVFDKISVIGGQISSIDDVPYYVIGGLIGNLFVYTGDFNNLKINNLYNSAHIFGNGCDDGFSSLNGIIGKAFIYGVDQFAISNVMNNGIIDFDNKISSVSAIMSIEESSVYEFILNNTISLHDSDIMLFKKAPSDYVENDISIIINNLYSESKKTFDERINFTKNNVKTGLSIYEIANEDYSSWSGFDNSWVHKKIDNVNRIPLLKGIDYDHVEVVKDAYVKIGETISVSDLVTNDVDIIDLTLLESCQFDLALCSNVTDNTIIKVEGGKITGLSQGNTSVIALSANDGFIGIVNINSSNDKRISVSFNANGGTGNMDKQIFLNDENKALSTNTFTKEGHTFTGWNTKADGSGTSYTDGQEVSLTKNITLYAIWQINEYKVTFKANGGMGTMPKETFQHGVSKALTANEFTREGHTFTGWNTKTDGSGTSYSNGQSISITSGITLYAMWKEDYDFIVNEYSFDKTNNYIDLIGIGTDVSYFESKIKLNNGYTISVEYKTIDNRNILYTGGKTKIYKNNNLYKELTNIVSGDIDEDGITSKSDYLKIREDIMNSSKLDGIYKRAADMNRNSEVDIIDYIRIKKIISGDN